MNIDRDQAAALRTVLGMVERTSTVSEREREALRTANELIDQIAPEPELVEGVLYSYLEHGIRSLGVWDASVQGFVNAWQVEGDKPWNWGVRAEATDVQRVPALPLLTEDLVRECWSVWNAGDGWEDSLRDVLRHLGCREGKS